jgi:hypothetical protein
MLIIGVQTFQDEALSIKKIEDVRNMPALEGSRDSNAQANKGREDNSNQMRVLVIKRVR